MRKETDVEAEIQDVLHRLNTSAEHVGRIRDHLEHIERDTHRQHNRVHREATCLGKTVAYVRKDVEYAESRAQQVVDHVREEIGVLKVSQQAQVDGYGKTEPHFRHLPSVIGLYPLRYQPVAQRHKGQNEQEESAGLIVEEPTDKQQIDIAEMKLTIA